MESTSQKHQNLQLSILFDLQSLNELEIAIRQKILSYTPTID